jgi:hypothetical protein
MTGAGKGGVLGGKGRRHIRAAADTTTTYANETLIFYNNPKFIVMAHREAFRADA